MILRRNLRPGNLLERFRSSSSVTTAARSNQVNSSPASLQHIVGLKTPTTLDHLLEKPVRSSAIYRPRLQSNPIAAAIVDDVRRNTPTSSKSSSHSPKTSLHARKPELNRRDGPLARSLSLGCPFRFWRSFLYGRIRRYIKTWARHEHF